MTGRDVPPEVDQMFINIVYSIRLPRVLLAMIVGSSLAVAGASFQGLLRNPLADPYTLGVSSEHQWGQWSRSFPSDNPVHRPIHPSISKHPVFHRDHLYRPVVCSKGRNDDEGGDHHPNGHHLQFVPGIFHLLMIALTGEELRQIIGWLLGSVSMRGWEYVGIVLPFFVVGVLLLLLNAKELNGMSFGVDQARYIGLSVQKWKLLILISGSILHRGGCSRFGYDRVCRLGGASFPSQDCRS